MLLVNDLASIDAVLQHRIKRTARAWLATPHATRRARPGLARNAGRVGARLSTSLPSRAWYSGENAAIFASLLTDDRLAGPRLMTERQHAARAMSGVGTYRPMDLTRRTISNGIVTGSSGSSCRNAKAPPGTQPSGVSRQCHSPSRKRRGCYNASTLQTRRSGG